MTISHHKTEFVFHLFERDIELWLRRVASLCRHPVDDLSDFRDVGGTLVKQQSITETQKDGNAIAGRTTFLLTPIPSLISGGQ
uniref:Uncharacterized protein n=1 Tax=Candidatus Kentrum sp. DK TaxID=2126562 RepID=A0A450TCT9_9GAMM|nr:MAG: hypothetical protein BECKDK2373B_GA0170837_11397 [Candidatus Kentron sp. DK]